MQQEERLSGALQENILTLLCFSREFSKIIRHSLSPSLFESAQYKEIASRAMDYIDQFGEPVQEHLPDTLEDILKGEDARKAQSYSKILDNLFISKDSVNGEYVISQLAKFVRQQNLKSAVIRAVEELEQGRVDAAESALQAGLQSQLMSFDPGTNLADPNKALRFLDIVEDGFMTGISELDKHDIMPRRKELFLFIAPPKKGKSWALINVGKWALLQRKRVLHVTLEMSEARVAQRYMQSIFSVSKREAHVKTPQFITEGGQLVDLRYEEVERLTLEDPNIRSKLASKLKTKLKRSPPLMIKEFPTGQLTIAHLNAYLDTLERLHKYTPDILILDYPDLMNIDGKERRTETGKIYQDLRGIGVQRNIAIVTASQGNRESSKAKTITDDMVAEDYSKIAIADNVITYNQTPEEKKLGLARLYVSNGRNDEDKFTVLLTQSYAIGQFCLDSMRLSDGDAGVLDNLVAGAP